MNYAALRRALYFSLPCLITLGAHAKTDKPNIDRIANEGAMFIDYYGEQSCTAGRSAFITGQHPLRTGLLKVGLPGTEIGLQAEDPTIAELLKPLGYATGQFGKNPTNKFGAKEHRGRA